MRKTLMVLLTIALVLTMSVVPTVSNADPGPAKLELDILKVAGPTLGEAEDSAIEASKTIKLVKGETYRLQFRITLEPPTGPEIRVRFPQSTIELSVNGTVDTSFRHRELYKYDTSKGSGEFLVVEGTAEFVADDTGKVELAVKGNNVAGATPVESNASATYNYTPATYADIIQHKVRVGLEPKEKYHWSLRVYDYATEVYPTDIIDNGSELWDIGSGITFGKQIPQGTDILFYDSDKVQEQPFFMAYCDLSIPGTFRSLRVKYPDGSTDDYMQNVDPYMNTNEILIRCSDTPSNPEPPLEEDFAAHGIYATADPSMARTYFNQSPDLIEKGLKGLALHGTESTNFEELLKAMTLPAGALGWTVNGIDLFDTSFRGPVVNRMLLYPLMPKAGPSAPAPFPYHVITYKFGDAEFYWAHEDLYGGMRPEKTVAAPPDPIPNDSDSKFLYWADENGAKVDFVAGIEANRDMAFHAVYESKTPIPSTPPTTPSTTPSTPWYSDDNEDDNPPVPTNAPTTTTTSEGISKTTISNTTAGSTESTSIVPTTPATTITNLEEEEVPLGEGTTTTPTTLLPSTTGDGTGDVTLPTTGLTANEVFWIGGGLIVLLGIILLVANKRTKE